MHDKDMFWQECFGAYSFKWLFLGQIVYKMKIQKKTNEY